MAQSRDPYANVKEGDVEFVDVAAKKKRAPLFVAAVVVVLAIVAILVVPQFAGTSATPTTPNAPQGMTPIITTTPAANQISVTLVVDATDANRGTFFNDTVNIDEGGNVYDALKASKLNITARQSFGMGAYVSAIEGLAEKSAGPTSGWLFYVNDKLSSQSSNKVVLHEGDSVRWVWRANATSVRS